MLHTVAELRGHRVGNVDRVLRHEIDADALRADEAHHLLHLVEQRRRRLIEQQVRLVEEEDEPGLVRVAHFGERFEQFGEVPEQEGGVKLRARYQPVGGEDVDDAAALLVEAHEVGDIERGLAEEMLAALRPELEQRALDCAEAWPGDVAIGGGQLVGALAAVDEHGLQVVEVEEQQPLLVGDVEGDGEHALLHLVEAHQPGEEQRPHLGDGGADRMALLAEQVPELDRIVGIGPVRIADLSGAGGKDVVRLRGGGAGHRHAGKVALHVGDEDGDAGAGEALRDPHQRHRLARAGRARDQPVPVGAPEVQRLRLAGCGADEDAVGHALPSRNDWTRHRPGPASIGRDAGAIRRGCGPR